MHNSSKAKYCLDKAFKSKYNCSGLIYSLNVLVKNRLIKFKM